jgi:hypothetical protein
MPPRRRAKKIYKRRKYMSQLSVVNGKVGEGVGFERIRRITGYLVGTLDRFNDAKRAEVYDRVKHEHEIEDAVTAYSGNNE